jgi:hypothetical protein
LAFDSKKTLHPIEQNREDVKIKRKAWLEAQPDMLVDKLVFLDETGINTGMTRLYGRAASNERLVDYTPDVRFERTTVLSSVRANGQMVPLIFDGTLNGDIFKEYIAKSFDRLRNRVFLQHSRQVILLLWIILRQAQ